MKAIWKDTVLAESNETVEIEGNHYFPADSLKKEYFKESNTHTTCVWKGEAGYYNIEVNGEVNEDSAWFYPDPKERAKMIKSHIAFWKGIQIVE